MSRVLVQPTPLLTPYFPKYSDETDDGLRALLRGEAVSALFGGSTPYLQADEEWPRCKTCGHALIPYLQINLSSERTPQEFRQYLPPLESEPGVTLFQIFICAEETDSGSCFEAWVMQVVEGESWLVRKIYVDADATGLDASPAHDQARASLEEDQFIPDRIISEWSAGNPETEHWEAAGSGADFDEVFYEAHKPADGLKLLGYGVRGKFYNSSSGDPLGQCTAGDGAPHFDWRCLIQLGTRDEDNPIYTTGNIYMNQCERHPEVFEAVCSGTW